MSVTLPESNPFAAPSTLAYRMPPFAEISERDYWPAFEAGMAAQLREVAEITANPETPTFANTIEALERTGQLLDRVGAVYFAITSSDNTPYLEELDSELAPLLAAHYDRIRLDSVLYERIAAVHATREQLGLSPEQLRLVERVELEHRLAGASLGEAQKQELADLNQRIAGLSSRFAQNLQAETHDLAVVVRDVTELDGLGEGEISSAASAAEARGLAGSWLITLPLFTGHPWLASLRNRGVRERIYRASTSRAARGNTHDNAAIVLEITRLRAERAALLGFATHADAKAADSMAGSLDAIRERMHTLIPAAVRNARAERAELQAAFDADRAAQGLGPEPLEPWDWPFYAEQLRASMHDVDTTALRPYFEAERVLRDGVFFAANREYGITFAERPDLVANHPLARTFEVSDADGSPLGLYILDLYARDGKRGGAWMTSFTQRNELLGEPTTVVTNQLNVPRPPFGNPTLLTLDEVETLFHEFGHALHGLFATTRYPHFAGTNVLNDFVEFPSQVNEQWMLDAEVLRNYAVHAETGAPLDPAIAERIAAAAQFGEGFGTTEYLAATMLDLALHSRTRGEQWQHLSDVEHGALAAAGLDLPEIPPRYSSRYFQHIFDGHYDAGYYGYIWSEVFDAASVARFREEQDARATGERFRRAILAPGGSSDPHEMVREFLGGDAPIEPLLRRRGLLAD